MIRSFRDRDAEALLAGRVVPKFRGIGRVARRKLLMLDHAKVVGELVVPPGNRLERLAGDRKGQWSIRINDQFRICFAWREGEPHDVEITDYH